MVDTLGNLTRFVLLPSQGHDSVGVEPLLRDISFEALIGDRAFDNDSLRAELNERRALAVIPPKSNRTGTIPYDKEMYKWRRLVENFFQKTAKFRRSAARYDCPKGRSASRPTPASAQPFISPPRSSHSNECPQTKPSAYWRMRLCHRRSAPRWRCDSDSDAFRALSLLAQALYRWRILRNADLRVPGYIRRYVAEESSRPIEAREPLAE